MEINAATRILALTRKELFERARAKGYKVTDQGTRTIVRKDKHTALIFQESGAIFFADMDLTATKNIPLKEAARILKL